MADMRPDLIMPDERAAGVISGSDPYRELELYLEKVNEEFGEVFERWLGSSDQFKIKQNGSLKSIQFPQPTDTSKNLCNGNQERKSKEITPLPVNDIHEFYLNSFRTRSLPSKTKTQNGGQIRRLNNIYAYASEKAKAVEKEWSDGLMAEFDKLIAMELNQLQIDTENKVEETRIKTKESSASPDADSSESTGSNSSVGSFNKNQISYNRSLSDESDVKIKTGKQNGDAALLKVTSLGEDTSRRGSDSQLPPRRPKRIPSPVRIKEFFRSTSPFGKRGKKDSTNNKERDNESHKSVKSCIQGSDIPPAAPPKRKKSSTERKIPIGLQNFLTKIRPSGTRSRSESPGEVTSGFNTMESSSAEIEDSLDAILSSVSTATQTSPALSRSSSFTWMSDGSSSIILNTPGSLSDVNDEKSSSSERSSSSPARLPCENGCGSECDCGTSGSRDSSGESPDSGDLIQDNVKDRQKLTRKETWEKIRRRHSELLRLGRKSYSGDVDVWVRRESVHTQTQNEPETDRETGDNDFGDNNLQKWLEIERVEGKPQGLPPRPKNQAVETNARSLPLEKSRTTRPQNLPIVPLTIRSLPSPTECEDQLSSPSTASLKLIGAALAPELGNKSSSAPVIMKQNLAVKKDYIKPEENTKKLECVELLLQVRPKDHIQFLKNVLPCAAMKKDKQRIVFLSPPSFNRELFSQLLADCLGIHSISLMYLEALTRERLMKDQQVESVSESVEEEICICPGESLSLPIMYYPGEEFVVPESEPEPEPKVEEEEKREEPCVCVCPCVKEQEEKEKEDEGKEEETDECQSEITTYDSSKDRGKQPCEECPEAEELSKKASEIQIDFGLLGECEFSAKGWILEDFPMTGEEACRLNSIGVLPTHALRIILDEEEEAKDTEYQLVVNDWMKAYKFVPALEIRVKERDLEELIRDMCSLLFLMPHRHAPMLPRIVLIGSRGSGVTTQGQKLAMKYGFIHVEYELVIAKALQQDDEFSKLYKIQSATRPDPELEAYLLEKALLTSACRNRGWVLTGYPRNIDQMRMLDIIATPPNRVIFIEVPAKECFVRLYYRKIDPCLGEIYKIPEVEPFGMDSFETPNLEPEVADRLVSHPKNNKKQIIHDIEEYFLNKQEMMAYCGKTASYVDGDKEVEKVFELIEQIIINSSPPHPPRDPLAINHGIDESVERLKKYRLAPGMLFNNLFLNPPERVVRI